MSLVGGTIYLANPISGMMTNLHVMCQAYPLRAEMVTFLFGKCRQKTITCAAHVTPFLIGMQSLERTPNIS